MIQENQLRGTSGLEYFVGSYGLEQKYCTELGGLNGLQKYGFNRVNESKEVLNGSDLYLTIDKNIQLRAEQILEQAIIEQTNANGSPKDGAIIIMEAKTGKIRGIASYPYFDPNDYEKYWQENPEAFRNAATSVDYDIGSVMKPLTVAVALNTYQSGYAENGDRKGVPPEWGFVDYASTGKPYQELNGNQPDPIRNAKGVSYKAYGKIGLKEIIRDSINTGIADIVDETGARKLREYYEEKFKFGQPTQLSLPGDAHGNTRTFTTDIRCPICYANFGFGQGFTASPLQLVRAYSALANDGFMVEPYLVEKIINKDGTVDDGTSLNSPIIRQRPQQVISSTTSRLVTSYMQSVVQDGYLGREPSSARVPGYLIAGKTGTAEVNRPYLQKDAAGNAVLNEKGNPVMVPCSYICNREKGLYDHTFIGYGPAKDPQYIILVKLSEPNPGVVDNFSSSTVGRPFSQMMEFTLNYYGVVKDF
jgi:cell division protein FtsI/penicillin-binding protein 2